MPAMRENQDHPALQAALVAAGIDARGGCQSVDWRIAVVDQAVSTNDLMLAKGADGEEEGACLFAECQTAGRGRRGDPWLSPTRHDLLFSILLRPEEPLEQWPRLPQLAAVALCRAIDHLAPALKVEAQIKWPNDIWLSGRKVAGLLVETRMSGAMSSANRGFAVLGVGLNVNGLEFPEELRDIATSLRIEAGGELMFDRNLLAATVLGEIGRIYPQGLGDAGFAAVRDVLHRRSGLIGRRVRADSAGSAVEGRVEGFGPNGELILSTASDGQKILHSADRLRLVDAVKFD